MTVSAKSMYFVVAQILFTMNVSVLIRPQHKLEQSAYARLLSEIPNLPRLIFAIPRVTYS